jgi:hypothetical protein
MKLKLIEEQGYLYTEDKKWHLPLNNNPIIPNLGLLPEIVVEDDVECKAREFANEIRQDVCQYNNGRWYGRFEAYKAATKVYSEDDLREAIMQAFLSGVERIEDYSEVESDILQSLKQPKTPKWFVAEIEHYYHSSKEFYADAGFVKCTKEQYESIKSEIPTCPLKTELKTTKINGKTYLVGTYLYE